MFQKKKKFVATSNVSKTKINCDFFANFYSNRNFFQCPDRLENRSHLSSFIVSILDETKITFYSNFLSWLLQFASHSKVRLTFLFRKIITFTLISSSQIGYRTGALSVISQIVVRPERTANENEELSNEDREVLSHKFLLQVNIS